MQQLGIGPRTSFWGVDANDDIGVQQRIVANVYADGALAKSTQSAMNGTTSGMHEASETLPDGSHTFRHNAEDLAGNIAPTGEFPFAIESTAPTATVKEGASSTGGSGGTYDFVDLRLFDAGQIASVIINGVVKDLANNTRSDVNRIKPGVFGAVVGGNALEVQDVAGHTTTLDFTLL